MKFKKLLLFAFLLTASVLNAQTDFRPGYIIKNSGDTLHGAIDYRGDLLMSSICRFRDSGNTTVEYSPDSIMAYRFIDSKYFVSEVINDKKVFLEYLIKGRINIYYQRDNKDDHYYIDKENSGLVEIPYEEGIRDNVNDKKVFYRSTKHIGMLHYYMQDAPELQSKIFSLKKPEHLNLIKLAESYHKAVCKDEKCIVYEKRQPFLKVNVELVSGVINFDDVDKLVDKSYLHSGMIANFWLPRVNEKLYIKTGVLYSQLKNIDGEKYEYIKIPVHIGYLAPKTYKIRPTVSIGLLSSTFSGGLITKLYKRVNIGVQSWVDFEYDQIPLIPKQFLSHSLLGSILVEL